MMGIRGPTAKGPHRKGECNHRFFGEDGGLPWREIILDFGDKQQSRGKTWGKSRLRAVIIVIIWGGVLGGLVSPRM